MRVRGAFDPRILAATVGALVRHESLPTTFPAPAGEPEQRIARQWAVVVPVVDLTRLGYLHRPGLTAQKFVPDPFAATRDLQGAILA